jgi:hypothetical protein
MHNVHGIVEIPENNRFAPGFEKEFILYKNRPGYETTDDRNESKQY